MTTGEQISLVAIARRIKESPPELDRITAGAVRHYELCRSLADAFPMHFKPVLEELEALRRELESHLLATGQPLADPSREIPTLPPAALTEADFAEFIQEPCPVVFKGAARDAQAVRDWTPAFFGERYGDFPCLLATETEWDIPGCIADAVGDIQASKDEARYAHNIANIFNQHPDLEAQLELQRFLPHLGPGRHLGTHLFLGGSKTGTAFHCANNLNIFVNVHGQKDWFFVHPNHTFWMYGLLHKTGGYGDSPIDHRRSAAEQSERFPLFQQIPVYSARLEPGDVLINPPWWWHAITNVTSSTIACAVRWTPRTIRDANPVFSLAQRMVPHSKEVMRILRDPKARITDELYREGFEPIRKER